MKTKKSERVKFDSKTKAWFDRNHLSETTVMKCEKCGRYYKPVLGHKCRSEDCEYRKCKECE